MTSIHVVVYQKGNDKMFGWLRIVNLYNVISIMSQIGSRSYITSDIKGFLHEAGGTQSLNL